VQNVENITMSEESKKSYPNIYTSEENQMFPARKPDIRVQIELAICCTDMFFNII
jgi:hypothetical protein